MEDEAEVDSGGDSDGSDGDGNDENDDDGRS